MNPVCDGESEAAVDLRKVTSAIAGGDTKAFETLYRAYYSDVYRYVLVMAYGDEDVARETIQEAFVRAFRKMRVFETRADFWRWLVAVCRSSYIDLYRKRTRTRSAEVLLEPEQIEALSPEAADSEWDECLTRALCRLNEHERALLGLVYEEEHPLSAVAAKMHTSYKSIESKLARTRRKLRVLIREEMQHATSETQR